MYFQKAEPETWFVWFIEKWKCRVLVHKWVRLLRWWQKGSGVPQSAGSLPGCCPRSQSCQKISKKGGGGLPNPSLDLWSESWFDFSWLNSQLNSDLCHFCIYRNQCPEKIHDLPKILSWKSQNAIPGTLTPTPAFSPRRHTRVSSFKVNHQEIVTTKKEG